MQNQEYTLQSSFFKQTRFDGLCCIHCGEQYLHHYQVESFNRDTEDSHSGTHVVAEDHSVNIDDKMKGNPSSRRDGITIRLWCEFCDYATVLHIAQHKGITTLELTREYLDKKVNRWVVSA